MNSDFLVIGSGIAGLSFAIRAAKHGTVTIITKGKPLESNTAWAQGGIASVLPEGLREEGDNVESHVADTLDAGAGLCDGDAVRTILSEAGQTIEELKARTFHAAKKAATAIGEFFTPKIPREKRSPNLSWRPPGKILTLPS